MLERLRALDATKTADLAAFRGDNPAFSPLRVLVGVGLGLGFLFGPAYLATVVGPPAILGWPLALLAGCCVLARTPKGRGALWSYGRGWSPWQQIRNLTMFTALLILLMAGAGIWLSLRR